MGIPKIAPPFWLHISWTSFEFVEISAGGQHWPATLANWWNCNAVELQSFSTSDIITTLKRLKSELTCPLFFNPLPPKFLAIDDFADSAPAGTDFADFADAVLITAERLFLLSQVLPQKCRLRGDSIARRPRTKKEVKAHLNRRNNKFERKLVAILAAEGSVARQN